MSGASRRLHRALGALRLLILAACARPGAQEVALIVNADDVGAHPVFTDASLEALLSGRISSASIIVPGRDADRALAILKDHPELDVGVHLTLNGDGPPLTPRERVPSLYNDKGTMWDTPEEVAARVRPPEARMEWEAQVRKALDAGIRVTHLDSHMACYFQSRELFRAALEVAKQYHIPLISPYIPGYVSAQERDLFPIASYAGIYRIEGREETLENRAEAYRRLLAGLRPGIHYLYTHHGRPQPGSSAEAPGDLDIRIDEFAFWTGELSERLLNELKCRLIRIKDLAKQE